MTTVNGKSMIRVGDISSTLSMREVLRMAQAEGHKNSNLPVVNWGRKIGRNELCPCGSGKKYKKCHLINIDSRKKNSKTEHIIDLMNKEIERKI